MRHLGILQLSPAEVRKLSIALDAAYEYVAWIRRQLANPSYLPARTAISSGGRAEAASSRGA
jgi:hypothetical protein